MVDAGPVNFEGVKQNTTENSDEVEHEWKAKRGACDYTERHSQKPGVKADIVLTNFFHESFGAGVLIIEGSWFDCCDFNFLFCDLLFVFLAGAICWKLFLRFSFFVAEIDSFFDEFDGQEGSHEDKSKQLQKDHSSLNIL